MPLTEGFFRSAPTQNARSPAPVSTTRRTPSSASSALQMRCNSASVARSIAFITCGRSIVTVATCPASSRRALTTRLLERGGAPGATPPRGGSPRAAAPPRNPPAPPPPPPRARRPAAQAGLPPRQPDRAGDEAQRPPARIAALDDHVVVQRLRVGQRLAHITHRRRKQVLLLKPGQPVLARVAGEALAQQPVQFGLVLELLRERIEAGIER